MIIIAGLGNPGAKYEKNRHNIGFMAADEISRRWRFGPERAKFQSIIAEGDVDGTKVLLMKPQTYMNESGRAVGEAVRFYTTGCVAGNPDGWAEPEVAAGRECRKVGRLKLTARDTADLVNFMYTLTDGWYDPATGLPGPMQVAPMPPIVGGGGRAVVQQH
jgi:hypothetical protein